MVQAEGDKRPVEGVRFERHSIGLTGALIVSTNRIFVLVSDIEHGESLIDTDDPASFQPLRHRPSYSTGARRQVENLFIALQREHIAQFLGQIVADLRGPAVKLSGMLWVMKARLVIVRMIVCMPVIVFVFFTHFFTVPSIIFRCSLLTAQLIGEAGTKFHLIFSQRNGNAKL